jgi:branched-chain amino acid aminotransferase
MVKNGVLLTSHADACLTGITRQKVIDIAKQLNIEVIERNISLSEFYNADEVFTTGTMGELTPVHEIDGRIIENKTGSEVRKQLYAVFKEKIEAEAEEV